MKKLRKLVSVLLAVSMCAITATTAFAAEESERPDLTTTPRQQIENIERIGTPEQIAQVKAKLNGTFAVPFSAESVQASALDVPHFAQTGHPYWCAVFTAKQTLAYIIGKIPSTDALAKAMNADEYTRYISVQTLLNVINGWQYRVGYAERKVYSIDDMIDNFSYAIGDDYPPIPVIDTTGHYSDFGYEDVHFLNVSGIKPLSEQVFIVDPGRSGSAGLKWISNSLMYDVIEEYQNIVLC